MRSRIRRWLGVEDIMSRTIDALDSANVAIRDRDERIASLETLYEDVSRRLDKHVETVGWLDQNWRSLSAVSGARLDSIEANDAVVNATLRTIKSDIDRAFAHLYDVRKDLEKPDTFWLKSERIDDHGHE